MVRFDWFLAKNQSGCCRFDPCFLKPTIIVKSVGKVVFFTSSFSSSPHPWPNVDQNVNVCARKCSVISQH